MEKALDTKHFAPHGLISLRLLSSNQKIQVVIFISTQVGLDLTVV